MKAEKTGCITDTLSRNILLLHFKRGMSATSIATIFSIGPEEVEEKIRNFTEQFSNRDYMHNVINALASMKMKNNGQENLGPAESDKDREIADLRRRLTEAEIRAEAYEEMVRLAEAAYGIRIRKKSGAK